MDPRSPAQIDRDLHLDAQAAELRAQDKTYRQIAAIQGCSLRAAWQRVQRHYSRLSSPQVAEAKARELANLDELELVAWRVLEAEHFVVIMSGPKAGVIVHGPRLEHGEPEPLHDGDAVLRAINTVLRIQERRAKLQGLDAPAKQPSTSSPRKRSPKPWSTWRRRWHTWKRLTSRLALRDHAQGTQR